MKGPSDIFLWWNHGFVGIEKPLTGNFWHRWSLCQDTYFVKAEWWMYRFFGAKTWFKSKMFQKNQKNQKPLAGEMNYPTWFSTQRFSTGFVCRQTPRKKHVFIYVLMATWATGISSMSSGRLGVMPLALKKNLTRYIRSNLLTLVYINVILISFNTFDERTAPVLPQICLLLIAARLNAEILDPFRHVFLGLDTDTWRGCQLVCASRKQTSQPLEKRENCLKTDVFHMRVWSCTRKFREVACRILVATGYRDQPRWPRKAMEACPWMSYLSQKRWILKRSYKYVDWKDVLVAAAVLVASSTVDFVMLNRQNVGGTEVSGSRGTFGRANLLLQLPPIQNCPLVPADWLEQGTSLDWWTCFDTKHMFYSCWSHVLCLLLLLRQLCFSGFPDPSNDDVPRSVLSPPVDVLSFLDLGVEKMV